jgi:hypothetical protein
MNPDAVVDIPAIRHMYPEVPAETIWAWVSRGKVRREGIDRQGRALYRLGDVATCASRRQAWLQKQQARV